MYPFSFSYDIQPCSQPADQAARQLAAEVLAPLPEGYCGPCYGGEGREGQCCNTCDDVRDA